MVIFVAAASIQVSPQLDFSVTNEQNGYHAMGYAFRISTSFVGRSSLVSTRFILFSTAIPSESLPKIACLPSSLTDQRVIRERGGVGGQGNAVGSGKD